MPLKVGDKFPDNVKFEWAPITDADPTACGRIQVYNASHEFQGKRVVLVSVPGAFSPGCQGVHIPPYLQSTEKFLKKGVDLIVVIAYNDAWVMNAWGKVNGVGGSSPVLFMSDTKSFFSKHHGWSVPKSERNGRWAMVIEKDGTLSYASAEEKPQQVSLSGADTVLAKL